MGVTVEYDSCDAWLSEFCCLPLAFGGEAGGVERGVLKEEKAGDAEGGWELVWKEDGGDLDDDWELVDRGGGDSGHDAPVKTAGWSWGGALRRALSG